MRHSGNVVADRLVLYLQDGSAPEEANHKIGCNLRCHAFDAGVVAGRMPAILEEERRLTLNRAFKSHVLQVVLAAENAAHDPEPVAEESGT